MTSRAPSPVDRRIAGALFVLAFAVLWATEAQVGFVRDESVYFAAAETFARWLGLVFQRPADAFSDAMLTRAFDWNHEHPMAMKALFGISWRLFHQGLGWLRPATAFRLPAFAMAALIPALLHAWGSVLYGRRAGLFAALCFLAVPRHFFHAHLACFDMPIASMWLLTVYAFWRSRTDARWWLFCGLAFGAALATKHNGFFLPLFLVPFALVDAARASQAVPVARRRVLELVGLWLAGVALFAFLLLVEGPAQFQRTWALLSPQTALVVLLAIGTVVGTRRIAAADADTFRAIAPVPAMALLGPAVFVGHWPYLWHHPVDRISWYLDFHATHVHYAWTYFGTILRAPPFPLTYVFVLTALTLPVSLLVPMGVGLLDVALRTLGTLWRRLGSRVGSASESDLLVGVHALASILIISLPGVPHFGGVKHWLPSMPFLALLAGHQVSRASDAFERWTRALRPHPGLAFAVLAALLLLPAVTLTADVHPYGTSAYGELAGGAPGAASLGLQRQYWSNNVTGVLPWINAHARPGARVWLHEVNGLSFRDYQRNGMLRPDVISVNGAEGADIAAVQYHQEFREQEISVWQAFGTATPVTGLYLDDTPQVVVYARPGAGSDMRRSR